MRLRNVQNIFFQTDFLFFLLHNLVQPIEINAAGGSDNVIFAVK